MNRGNREILTEDILERCDQYYQDSYREFMDIIGYKSRKYDLGFFLTERIFWDFVDDKEFEELDFDDLEKVVYEYLNIEDDE